MRVIRFVLHNWPLKVGAIALAIILYGGMLVLQNARSWDNSIPIDPVNEPPNVVLMDTLPQVTRIRFVAAADVPITRDSFTATINLATVQPSASKPVLVAVQVETTDPRIQILDYEPQQISIRLEPLVSKSMIVEPSFDTPAGLTTGDPTITPATVTVQGAASDVAKVAVAKARILVETSGLDVDRDFPVIGYDADGKEVSGVEFTPPTVHVRMTVGSEIRSVTLPVTATVSGSPAAGYFVSSVDVTPVVVQVRGEADALGPLRSVATKPVSVAGATSDVTQQVALDLPSGVDSSVTAVKVVVHVQAVTETRTLTVAVVLDAARNDRNYSLSVTQVMVTVSGPVAALNALDTSTLVAVASVGTLGPGTYSVQLSLSPSPPANVQLVRIEPVSVQVTVAVPPSASPAAGPSASPT